MVLGLPVVVEPALVEQHLAVQHFDSFVVALARVLVGLEERCHSAMVVVAVN